MRMMRRMIVALSAVLLLPIASFGQAMSQVPSNAFVVVHVKSMSDMNTKIAAIGAELGLPPGATPASDALGYVTKHLGLTQGVNAQGDFAFAMVDTAMGFTGATPPIVLIIPVTDYKAALANFPSGTTDGAITTVQLSDGATAYIANWGNYLALSPTKDCVAGTPGGLVLTDVTSKEVDGHDVCAVVNMPELRTKFLPLLAASRQMVLMQMGIGLRQQPQFAKYVGAIQVLMGQAMDLFQNILTQCDDVALGLNLSTDAIGASFVVDFQPTSHYGQIISSVKQTDQSLLVGLPDGKYMIFGGAISDPKAATQIVSDFLDPIVPELQKIGPDAQPYLDYIQGIKDTVAAQTGAAFAFAAPQGELGTSPMLQFITTRTGDAKTISTAAAKMVQTQMNQMKAGAMPGMQMPVQMTFTPAAKTVDGVTFDQIHTGLDMAGALTPQTAKIGQYLSFVYGQDGLNIYAGVVNDNTYLQVGGMGDDQITAAVEAVKAGSDPLSKLPGVLATGAKLPSPRVAVVYVPVDTIVNTVFGYMAKFGLDMGVTMPATDPIGVGISNSGSAVRYDVYIPGQILTAGAQIAQKLMVHGAGPGGAGGAAPPAGGGM